MVREDSLLDDTNNIQTQEAVSAVIFVLSALKGEYTKAFHPHNVPPCPLQPSGKGNTGEISALFLH